MSLAGLGLKECRGETGVKGDGQEGQPGLQAAWDQGSCLWVTSGLPTPRSCPDLMSQTLTGWDLGTGIVQTAPNPCLSVGRQLIRWKTNLFLQATDFL